MKKKRSIDSVAMKMANRAHILEIIRQSSAPRIEIARRTGLTRAAVSVIVD